MRARAVVVLVALGGCRALLGIDDPQLVDGGGGGDGAAGDGCVSFSHQVDTCALPAAGDLVLAGSIGFDTDTGMLFEIADNTPIPATALTLTTSAGAIEALIVANLELGDSTQLRAIGSRPFAVIASGAITLATKAEIDVSSGGAGARPGCGGATPIAGQDRDGGAGGGGGGGFQGSGGAGGNGNSDGVTSAGGGGGGAVAFPGAPLGGCSGARGGNDNNDVGGAGGGGGGAVYLVAAQKIELLQEADVSAGGGGGRGGAQHANFDGDGGGGGGGSGGMILLEAPLVRIAGTLAANGGGGGEGSGGIAPGSDGLAGVLGAQRASGGTGKSSTGSDGGAGGASTAIAGDRVTALSTGGAGGGGGGAGFVRLDAAAVDGTGIISPAPI